ncbi:MAG: hypothetical protein KatS3mg051_0802 [Anaerolineae bacterium]|nr:MAG: hypothetical protein KatS3mg051_0802 [Anaerolineae bacterium]
MRSLITGWNSFFLPSTVRWLIIPHGTIFRSELCDLIVHTLRRPCCPAKKQWRRRSSARRTCAGWRSFYRLKLVTRLIGQLLGARRKEDALSHARMRILIWLMAEKQRGNEAWADCPAS